MLEVEMLDYNAIVEVQWYNGIWFDFDVWWLNKMKLSFIQQYQSTGLTF